MFADPDVWDVQHVGLAKTADILVVAPATANCLGKVAHGIADDLLTAGHGNELRYFLFHQ